MRPIVTYIASVLGRLHMGGFSIFDTASAGLRNSSRGRAARSAQTRRLVARTGSAAQVRCHTHPRSTERRARVRCSLPSGEPVRHERIRQWTLQPPQPSNASRQAATSTRRARMQALRGQSRSAAVGNARYGVLQPPRITSRHIARAASSAGRRIGVCSEIRRAACVQHQGATPLTRPARREHAQGADEKPHRRTTPNRMNPHAAPVDRRARPCFDTARLR
jgi:hypothetical protein